MLSPIGHCSRDIITLSWPYSVYVVFSFFFSKIVKYELAVCAKLNHMWLNEVMLVAIHHLLNCNFNISRFCVRNLVEWKIIHSTIYAAGILHFPTDIYCIFQCKNLPIQPEPFLFYGLQIGRNCACLLRKSCFLLGGWKIPLYFIGWRFIFYSLGTCWRSIFTVRIANFIVISFPPLQFDSKVLSKS